MNFANAVQRMGHDYADRLALRQGDTALIYSDLVNQSRRVATMLGTHGVQAGDRVAILLPNCIEYLPIVFAIWQVGAVGVPLNSLLPKEQLAHVMADSGASAIIGTADSLPGLAEIAPGATVFTLGAATGGAIDIASLDGVEVTHRIAPRRDSDDALIMYTSGSTGKPKGVRQTHRNIYVQIDALADTLAINADDIALNTMALFHVSGLQFGSLPVLLRGGAVLFIERWDPRIWIEMVQRDRPTISTLITTMLIDVSNLVHNDPVDLSSLRLCMFGGSRTPPSAIERFRAGTGIDPVEIYGATETNGITITYNAGEARRPGAAGRGMIQANEFCLVPPGGTKPLAADSREVGELWVRGDTVTPGYWNLPDVTAEKLRDGWLRSGDLMWRDDDGYFYYVDRIDDMIVSGGENVYPQAVEASLAACPLIAEVVVFGTPHPRWVQQVTALIVPVNADVTAEQILDFCRTAPGLSGIHRPKRIEFADLLPRTGSGKLDRTAVKRRFADETTIIPS